MSNLVMFSYGNVISGEQLALICHRAACCAWLGVVAKCHMGEYLHYKSGELRILAVQCESQHDVSLAC